LRIKKYFNKYFSGPEASHRRSIYKATGFDDEDLSKPLIGVANSWSEISPGHAHLKELTNQVKMGILQNGGTPFEFGIPSVCGNISMGTKYLNYGLVIRDVIAACIEIVSKVHVFDGLVLLSSCDNIIPGEIMAAERLNLPTIIVTGGPMFPGIYKGNIVVQPDLNELVTILGTKDSNIEKCIELENCVCPGPGACPVLGTANTMQILSEALGIALSGSATIPAQSSKRLIIAKKSGRKIVDLIKKGIKVSDIITRESLENAIMVDLAIGGSTMAILHLLTFANEFEIDLNLERFDEYSRKIPTICNVKPNGPYTVIDLDKSGGVIAIMKELEKNLNLGCMTVDEKNINEIIKNYKLENTNRKVIYPIGNPLKPNGGIAVLKGNLSPNGAIVRTSAISDKMLMFKGPAKAFNSDQQAYEAIIKDKIKKGEIIVVRYEGPKGAPGMKQVMLSSSALIAKKLDESVALLTDGSFSGFSKGPIIGHISPEAMEGGLIALIKNGDIIEINIPERELNLIVSKQELINRKKYWKKPKPKVHTGVLKIYSKLAAPAERGASINTRNL